MSGGVGFEGARTATVGAAGGAAAAAATRAAPQVYHDAVLASQQSEGPAARPGGSEAMPPLVPPPIDPSLDGYVPGPQAGTATGVSTGAIAAIAGANAARAEARQPGQGFPLARVFDGVRPDGSPLITRPKLDPREIPALVAYLTRAPVALSAPGTTRDELVTTAPPNVPRLFHTDGTWVWPAAVGFYLGRYQLPPQAEFLAHIRARHYALTPVHPQTVQAAGAQIIAMLEAKRQAAAQDQGQGQGRGPEQAQRAQAAEPSATKQGAAQAGAQAPAPAPVAAAAAASEAPAAAAVPAASGAPSASGSVARLPEFSAAFNAAGNRHAAWVTEQLETFLAFLPLGDWSVDHASRTYWQSGREFIVDGLGTLSPEGVWTWAWANPATWGRDSAITEQSRRLRALGAREQVPELVTPAFGLTGIADAPESPLDAAEMIAWTAMGLLGTRGYIGHSAEADGTGGRIYYVVCDSTVPTAAPKLGTVPRFVMEGAATFGEDAADCVLGYVEHYGWEWSRVPDGIVVAAEGIGSFTVEISAEGRLTGLSLHT